MWDCQPPQRTEPLLRLTLNKEMTEGQEAQTSVLLSSELENYEAVINLF